MRAFDRADPSPELNQTQTHAGRQAGRRVPLPEPDEMAALEPDDRYQNQTTTLELDDDRSSDRPADTTNDPIIDRTEPELQYRPVTESNQGLLGRHPRQPPFECTASEWP